jgi:hypothetical protein
MAAKELNVRKVDEIKRLKKMGFGKRKSARTLNIHRDTVTKYFEENSPSDEDIKEGPIQSSDVWANSIDWQDIREQMERVISLNLARIERYTKLWKDRPASEITRADGRQVIGLCQSQEPPLVPDLGLCYLHWNAKW